ncbi:MAG TPA: ABC transporter substrate-binding protein, partial [Promineifilum sp.]|nr:ABC transporter substrate-binding protein [Promineifilum sp.]
LRRMKLSEKIDWFTGVISAGDTVALGPVAEELEIPTIFTDGCTDHLFEVVDKKPKFVFRVTNILSSDSVACMIAASRTWPNMKRIAHIHPDYAFGRTQFAHAKLVSEKLYPGSETVSENWPKLFSGDYTSHIAKIIAAKPDLLVVSLWGGDYIAFYKQALTFGLYDKMKVLSNIGFGIEPSAIGKDHPEGVLAGAHANYHFTYPPADQWPLNKQFVERYHKRWNEYPNYAAEGAYTTLYLLKAAIEKANKLVGGWPSTEQIIMMLEGMTLATPAGYLVVRPEDHSGFKPIVIGFSKNVPEYPFPIWDPERIITIDIREVTAPPNWPKPGEGHKDPSATYNWIKTTWKS